MFLETLFENTVGKENLLSAEDAGKCATSGGAVTNLCSKQEFSVSVLLSANFYATLCCLLYNSLVKCLFLPKVASIHSITLVRFKNCVLVVHRRLKL